MDIVDELRRIERAGDLPPRGHPLLAKRAADAIERLRRLNADLDATNERLRAGMARSRLSVLEAAIAAEGPER